jgi:hypothetical protein
VAVAPNGAALMVGYYSRANDPADLVFHRRSRLAGVSTTTGAVSWAAQSFQLGPDTPVAIGQDPAVADAYMGDYDQIATSTGYFHAAWSDNRDGNAFHQHQPDVFYAKVAQTPATTDPAVSLSGPASVPIASNVACAPGSPTAAPTPPTSCSPCSRCRRAWSPSRSCPRVAAAATSRRRWSAATSAGSPRGRAGPSTWWRSRPAAAASRPP